MKEIVVLEGLSYKCLFIANFRKRKQKEFLHIKTFIDELKKFYCEEAIKKNMNKKRKLKARTY